MQERRRLCEVGVDGVNGKQAIDGRVAGCKVQGVESGGNEENSTASFSRQSWQPKTGSGRQGIL